MGKKCSIKAELCKGFQCTGFDGMLPDGKNAWKEIENVVKKIPCDSCKDDGLKRISGLHDIVNLGIGEQKKPFNPSNLKQFVSDVNCVYDKCKARGDCV